MYHFLFQSKVCRGAFEAAWTGVHIGSHPLEGVSLVLLWRFLDGCGL